MGAPLGLIGYIFVIAFLIWGAYKNLAALECRGKWKIDINIFSEYLMAFILLILLLGPLCSSLTTVLLWFLGALTYSIIISLKNQS